jgi:hypothetical protein
MCWRCECLESAGFDPELVSHQTVLVCPENFANQPVATLVDVRPQLAVLRRQLARMAKVDELLRRLPAGLTFDPGLDPAGTPTRPAAELISALRTVPARYAPECQSHCELSTFCREGASHSTASLGLAVREQVGGLDEIEVVLGLADGSLAPTLEQEETAAMLRLASRLRTEVLNSGALGSGAPNSSARLPWGTHLEHAPRSPRLRRHESPAPGDCAPRPPVRASDGVHSAGHGGGGECPTCGNGGLRRGRPAAADRSAAPEPRPAVRLRGPAGRDSATRHQWDDHGQRGGASRPGQGYPLAVLRGAAATGTEPPFPGVPAAVRAFYPVSAHRR